MAYLECICFRIIGPLFASEPKYSRCLFCVWVNVLLYVLDPLIVCRKQFKIFF